MEGKLLKCIIDAPIDGGTVALGEIFPLPKAIGVPFIIGSTGLARWAQPDMLMWDESIRKRAGHGGGQMIKPTK